MISPITQTTPPVTAAALVGILLLCSSSIITKSSNNRAHTFPSYIRNSRQAYLINMVKYILSLKADLEGVASLQLAPECDLCLSVRNPVQIEETRERIVVESSAPLLGKDPKEHHKHGPKHDYGPAPSHFSLKWDGAKQLQKSLG